MKFFFGGQVRAKQLSIFLPPDRTQNFCDELLSFLKLKKVYFKLSFVCDYGKSFGVFFSFVSEPLNFADGTCDGYGGSGCSSPGECSQNSEEDRLDVECEFFFVVQLDYKGIR